MLHNLVWGDSSAIRILWEFSFCYPLFVYHAKKTIVINESKHLLFSGIVRVQDFLKEAERNNWIIQLYQFTPGKPYRDTFWEINKAKVVNIVLDVKRENMINVLRHVSNAISWPMNFIHINWLLRTSGTQYDSRFAQFIAFEVCVTQMTKCSYIALHCIISVHEIT
jgi:hypothetical protein